MASIFPGSEVINENRRLVVATPVRHVKTARITVTPPVLKEAQALIFLVSGSEKAQALHEVLEGEYKPERLPAQLIRANKSTVLWLVDQQAASMLRSQMKS